jgi:hypothetical protein
LESYLKKTSEYYIANAGRDSTPVSTVLMEVERKHPGIARHGGEEYPERHGIFAGEYWRKSEPEHQLGFLEGYLDCWRKEGLKSAKFSKPANWYRGRISEWYGTTGDQAEYREDRREEKIADVLRRYRDQ